MREPDRPVRHRIVVVGAGFAEDGAPETPTAFAQTSDGHLWIGAQAGLFRFDGTRFELSRSPLGDRLQSCATRTIASSCACATTARHRSGRPARPRDRALRPERACASAPM